MTAYLLDTHVLLWALSSPGKLSPIVKDVIGDRGNSVYVSAASAWEIATKNRVGKLPGVEELIQHYDQRLNRLGVIELPISASHALAGGALQWGHRDPFDRILAAQAIAENLTLISADAAFSQLPTLSLLQ